MNLTCYCDHCKENICTTGENGLCYAQMTLNNQDQVVESYNCFHHNFTLVQNMICDHETNMKLSSTILKCCNTGSLCNHEPNFLPKISEAKRILLENKSRVAQSQASSFYLPSSSSLNTSPPFIAQLPGFITDPAQADISNKTLRIERFNPYPIQLSLNSAFEQYSHVPTEFKFVLVVLSGLLVVVSLALGQSCLARRRARRLIQTLPTVSNSVNPDFMVTFPDSIHQTGDEESVSSSGKTSSEAGETNSMASREPLIGNISPILNTISMNHPHFVGGPWMVDPSSTTKGQSTFQMTMGTGDTQKRPDNSSGSGAGQPYLNQRSIAHDIELLEVVGRGYFGVVWKGEYKSEPVAVKIFSTMAEPSWERETEIYETTMLRHKNILGFIASDKSDDGALTGYWLVTDFYPMGSLYDFLNRNSLALPDALRMAFSIANGLAHLHVEIFGTRGKPAIAHRDIKSKNILVKNDGTCCIGDLGMAVRYSSQSGIVDVPANSRVGTRRYLAPELLENRLNLMDFEFVKSADVYALGLVLWEVLRRTVYVTEGQATAGFDPNSSDSLEKPTTGSNEEGAGEEKEFIEPLMKLNEQSVNTQNQSIISSYPQFTESIIENLNETIDRSIDDLTNELAVSCDPYEAPYAGFLTADPSIEELRMVVCVQKIRPTISYRWTRFAPMRDYAMLMSECWYEKSQARLSALRVRKTIGDIAKHYFNLNMIYD